MSSAGSPVVSTPVTEPTLAWPSRSEYLRWRAAEWAGYPALGIAMTRANAPETAQGLAEETVSFGEDPAQRLLLSLPDPRAGTTAPKTGGDANACAVLFVHGGSWKTQEPERYRFVARWFAARGLPAGAQGYRHVPGALWPAQRDDVLAAARALKERTGATRIVLAGHSAGAHLAAAAVYDRVARRATGLADEEIAGLIVLSGPLDWRLICPRPEVCPLIQDLMGSDEGWDAADPTLLVSDGDTWPVLAIHGARDPLVNASATTSFATRVARAGAPARLEVLPEAGHSTLLWGFLDGREPGTVMEGFLAELTDPHAADGARL